MIEGHAKGGVLITRFEYVKDKLGKNGLKELINNMRMKGYNGPGDPWDLKMAQMYPMSHLLLLLESYRELHGEEAMDLMCKDVAKRKGIVGWFISWAGNPGTVLKKASSYWPNFYDFGKLEGKAIDDGRGVLKGYDISPSPIFCRSLTSYYLGIMEYIKAENPVIEHTKCVHNGDEYCEWKLSWE